MLNKTKNKITNRPLLQPGSDLIGQGDGQRGGDDRQGNGAGVRTHGHRHGLRLLRLEQLLPVDGSAVNHFCGRN